MQKFKFIIMENRAGQTERVNLVKVNVYCGYMVEDYMPKDPILRFVNETNWRR